MPNPSKVIVKHISTNEAALVGEILGDAFSEDPVMRWISPDPEYPKWCWPLAVPFLLPYDEVYIAGNGLGAAMWIPPGAKLNIRPGLSMLLDAWRRFGIGSIIRFFRLMSILERHHPKDSHYYLFAIGVRSEVQKQGIGSALLEHILHECDRRKVGAYLESGLHNLPFYQRHGFEVRGEITLPHNGPILSLMYRDPMPNRG